MRFTHIYHVIFLLLSSDTRENSKLVWPQTASTLHGLRTSWCLMLCTLSPRHLTRFVSLLAYLRPDLSVVRHATEPRSVQIYLRSCPRIPLSFISSWRCLNFADHVSWQASIHSHHGRVGRRQNWGVQKIMESVAVTHMTCAPSHFPPGQQQLPHPLYTNIHIGVTTTHITHHPTSPRTGSSRTSASRAAPRRPALPRHARTMSPTQCTRHQQTRIFWCICMHLYLVYLCGRRCSLHFRIFGYTLTLKRAHMHTHTNSTHIQLRDQLLQSNPLVDVRLG